MPDYDHYGQRSAPVLEELPLFAWMEEDPLPEPPEEAPDYQPPVQKAVAGNAERLLAYLKDHGATGRANAILGNELVVVLDMERATNLRNAVKHLRDNGTLVLSTIAGGYYLAAGVAELEEFLQENYLNRMAAMAESSNAMINHARAVYGAPANEIKAIRIVRVDHPDLPERIHN